MARAPTGGSQLQIRPWDLARELAQYLDTEGLGTFGTSIFLGRYPDSPIAATLIVPDPSPKRSGDPVSRLHYTVYFRDTDISTSAARAVIAWELLHHQRPPLPSYDVFVEFDHAPGTHHHNVNNYPVHTLGMGVAGMVRRA